MRAGFAFRAWMAGTLCTALLMACGGGSSAVDATATVATPVEATVGTSFLPPDAGVAAATALSSDQLPPDLATPTGVATDQLPPAS